jgi:hypothetical protein
MTGLIQLGHGPNDGHYWDGASGIITSQSAAASSNYTSVGIATGAEAKGISGTITTLWSSSTVAAGDTLVMYTYGGDANLDGKLNVDDYSRIDSGIASGLTGWSNGDFNYDGKVNVDDYTIIDRNIGAQGAPFATADSIGASGSGVTAVPEPAGIGVVTMGIGAILASRRRRLVQRRS